MKEYNFDKTMKVLSVRNPSLQEMGVDPVLLAMVEDLTDATGDSGIARSTLEEILRCAFFFHQNPAKIVFYEKF